MRNIVFIAPILSQPRVVKRIKTIIDGGFTCKVYGFFDGTYINDINKFPYKIDGVLKDLRTKYSIVNRIIFRVYPYYAINKIYKKHKKDSVFYVFDYDMAKVLYRIGCRNYVYEEADINSSKIANRIHRNFAVRFDKKIALKSLFTVYTSQGFVNYLFGDSNVKPTYLVIPNKLNVYFNNQDRESIEKRYDINRLKFGFIGLIRYPETIFKFASIVANYSPLYEFHFFGKKSDNLIVPADIEEKNNVFFHGAFANPNDLENIYKTIDINVACYDTKSTKMGVNVRVAEPNKLYESIYFKTPIIVSEGTFVGEKVTALGVGEAIDASDAASILGFLKTLTEDKLKRITANTAQISKEELIDNPGDILDRLAAIVE